MEAFLDALEEQARASRFMIGRYLSNGLTTGWRKADGMFVDTTSDDLSGWRSTLEECEKLLRQFGGIDDWCRNPTRPSIGGVTEQSD